jgi:hypothetical protein
MHELALAHGGASACDAGVFEAAAVNAQFRRAQSYGARTYQHHLVSGIHQAGNAGSQSDDLLRIKFIASVAHYARSHLDHDAAGVDQQCAMVNRSVGLVSCGHTTSPNKKPLRRRQRGGLLCFASKKTC